VIDFSRLAFSSLNRVGLVVDLAAPASCLPLRLFLVAWRSASSSLSLSKPTGMGLMGFPAACCLKGDFFNGDVEVSLEVFLDDFAFEGV
jgi:hypothetical protein